MNHTLEQQIDDYRQWRERLAGAIGDYRDWLDRNGGGDALQDLRLYDLTQAVNNDRLVMAFVAEFARGKTETINALFFSDFKTRLLPCDAGRTTMCPTEIFWDPKEEPYVRLLPIETRKRDDGLAMLKLSPREWTRLRLDTSSADSMRESLRALVQQKEVSLEEARALGLWDDQDHAMAHALQSRGTVPVPVWRHALINYPHPLLKSGLVILDTPGLNTLGTEPELTISIIPNAHAVVFLMATDTGVTRSDMEIWTRYIRDRASRKLAVLNKIDTLWDDLKSASEVEAMIQAQVEDTSRRLGLPAADIFPISAQKALVARVRGDAALLARSGIERVEEVLARDVVGAKHAILRKTVVGEVANMVKDSRKALQQRLLALRAQRQELESLRGQNSGAVQALLNEVSAERRRYEATVRSFNAGHQQLHQVGERIMEMLSLSQLDRMLDNSRRQIGDSWTTRGLNQGMKNLMRDTGEMADAIARQAQELADAGAALYRLFHTEHGFEPHKPRTLDLTDFLQAMRALEAEADAFCRDPVNLMTEKHFLVRKFFFTLGAQARAHFAQARHEADSWLKSLLAPLKQEIAEHKAQLERRSEALLKVHQDMTGLQQSMEALDAQAAALQAEGARLDQILLALMQSGPAAAQEPRDSTAARAG